MDAGIAFRFQMVSSKTSNRFQGASKRRAWLQSKVNWGPIKPNSWKASSISRFICCMDLSNCSWCRRHQQRLPENMSRPESNRSVRARVLELRRSKTEQVDKSWEIDVKLKIDSVSGACPQCSSIAHARVLGIHQSFLTIGKLEKPGSVMVGREVNAKWLCMFACALSKLLLLGQGQSTQSCLVWIMCWQCRLQWPTDMVLRIIQNLDLIIVVIVTMWIHGEKPWAVTPSRNQRRIPNVANHGLYSFWIRGLLRSR